MTDALSRLDADAQTNGRRLRALPMKGRELSSQRATKALAGRYIAF